jgi:hypothetical protein
MQLRRFLAAAFTLASLLPMFGCSKTEDVAPERKIFGEPPEIVNFRILNPDGSEAASPQLTPATVQCDYSRITEIRWCTFGFPGLHATPPIVVQGTYTQVVFEAVVNDPNTVRDAQGQMTESNLLLVASSFVLPNSSSETTLVLFNDAGANQFPQNGRVPNPGGDCSVDEFGNCSCGGERHMLDSNDPVKEVVGNEIFTRGFAFTNNSSSPYLEDCIMREKHQVPYPLAPGSRIRFRIDAVDRQGNLDTWENTPEVVVGQDAFDCTGDPCGCCILSSTDPTSECAGKPGMVNDFGAELCKNPPFG